MRVSHKLLHESAIQQLERITENLWKLEKQVSSGKQITTISDDPLGGAKVLNYRTAISQIDQYERNIAQAKSWLSYTESILAQIEDPLLRAKEIALTESSAPANGETRQIAAEEVRHLFGQILQLANTKLADRYIFSGTKTDTAPFTDEDGDLEINDGTIDKGYQGNEEEIKSAIDQTSQITVNINGKELFELGDGTTFFDILKDLHNALINNDKDGIADQINRLDDAMERVRVKLSYTGSRINRVELAEGQMADIKLNITELLSKTEDTDMIKAISDLANQQTLYEAALRSTVLISRMSLMDFLR